MALAQTLALAALAAGDLGGTASLEVHLDAIRDSRGRVLLCVTRDARYFPDCSRDPAARHLSVPASRRTLSLGGLRPGAYAVSVVHDVNANGRLDSSLGIPREGFGFSRNPAIRFGPPRFSSVVMTLPAGLSRVSVRMQYIL